MALAFSITCSPNFVIERLFVDRSKIWLPRYSSSFLICPLKVGCDTLHTLAAFIKLPWSATATMYERSLRFIVNENDYHLYTVTYFK